MVSHPGHMLVWHVLLSRRVVYSILHRILYFLPVGERGVCWWWKEREKRMIILGDVHRFIYIYMGASHDAHRPCLVVLGNLRSPYHHGALMGATRSSGAATRALSGRIIFGCYY